MSLAETLTLIPGFAGLALSAFLLWRTELRRARLSLRLLAAPGNWKITMARHGSNVQATDPAEADYLSMYGTFPIAATNDGPRGGALWGIAAELRGTERWNLVWFNSGQELPYALPGRTCEGWSQASLSVACDFDMLGDGLRELQKPGEVTFAITYWCQGWRGSARQKQTSLQLSRASLLKALENGARFIDLATCQVVPVTRRLARERFGEFDLADYEIDILTKWALLPEIVEYVTVPDGSPGGLKIAIRRSSGQVDQGWAVGVGRDRDILARIIEAQRGLVAEVEELKAGAARP